MNLTQFRNLINGIIVDEGYGITGTYIWLPYGLQLRSYIFLEIDKILRSNNYEYYELPILIPERLLNKQKRLISFERKVIFVSQMSDKPPKEKIYLRPDGITQFSYMAARWINSYKDLPMRLVNKGPIFRSGARIPLLSGNGTLMIEGYTFHISEKEALNEIDIIEKFLRELLDRLYIPALVLQRPIHGNYPISERTIGFDVPISIGKTIQSASLYYHGTKYSSIFQITYKNATNKLDLIKMCSWGISERLIGIMLMLCSDEQGIIIPPEFAPIQIVIIPIIKSKIETSIEIERAADNLNSLLEKNGLRSIVDKSDTYVAKKREYYERRGVPIRIEIGINELKSNNILVARRNKRLTETIKIEDSTTRVKVILEEISKDLRIKVADIFNKSLIQIYSIKDLLDSDPNKVKIFGYCGSELCESKIRNIVRGEILGVDVRNINQKCIVCGLSGKRCYFSKRY